MADGSTTVASLRERVADFVTEREWKMYHNPKDLAIALSVEASELLDLFQWTRPEEIDLTDPRRSAIEEELADVFIYALHMANSIECDLSEITLRKLAKNAKKYPVEGYRGRAREGV